MTRLDGLSRRVRRRPIRPAWIARAEDQRTNRLVRDELQAICDRRDAGTS